MSVTADYRPITAVIPVTGCPAHHGSVYVSGGTTVAVSGRLPEAVSEFGVLNAAADRANCAYEAQLALAVGLHFAGALVDAYLFCLGALTPGSVPSIDGVRAFNDLWRVCAVTGAAHYAFKQVCARYRFAVCGKRPRFRPGVQITCLWERKWVGKENGEEYGTEPRI